MIGEFVLWVWSVRQCWGYGSLGSGAASPYAGAIIWKWSESWPQILSVFFLFKILFKFNPKIF